MVIGLAGDAVFLLLIGAVLCPVIILATRSTGVSLRNTFPCDMVPVVAFHAADQFFLGFGYLDASLADGQSCQDSSVSVVNIGEGQNEMRRSLVSSVAAVCGLHPVHGDEPTILDAICFRYFL